MSKKAFFKKLLVAGLCAVTATATVGFVACKKDKDEDNKKNEQVQEHNVTWDLDGGSWQTGKEGKSKVEDGAKLTKPDNPTKSGKEFDKWVLKADGTAYDFDSAVKSDVALKAVWKDPTPGGGGGNGGGGGGGVQTTEYTVTIDLDGGTWEGVTSPVKVGSGKSLMDILDALGVVEPAKSGHEFAGFINTADSSAFDLNTVLTGDISIKATWTAVHQHTWAEAPNYSKDADGHWLAATCEGHTAYKKPDTEVPHVDANGDNVCDVVGCEYNGGALPAAYTALVNKQGATKLVANSFLVSSTLPTFEEYGTAGLYQPVPTATNYVQIKNGKASLITPNASPATNLYVDFGGVTGTIEGYFEISDMQNGLSGYTPVQFEGTGGTKTELFGLAAESNLKYRLNGNKDTLADGTNAVTLSATATYGIGFVYNTTTKVITVTVSVDGAQAKAFTEQTLSGSLTGIKFSTGSSNNKTFSVDNVVVVNTPLTVGAYKDVVAQRIVAIENELGISEPNAPQDLKAALVTAKTAYETAVADVDTTAAVDEAYATYESAVVTALKANFATVQTSRFPRDNYDDNNAENYDTLIGAVTDATTYTTVMAACNAAYEAFMGGPNSEPTIKPDSWYSAAAMTVNIIYTTDSEHTVNVENLKVGDNITLDAVQEAHGTIFGYNVLGYYKNANLTDDQITDWPVATQSTDTTVNIYVKVELATVNNLESWFVQNHDDTTPSTETFAVDDNVIDNTLFTLKAGVALKYSPGKTNTSISSGSNALAFNDLSETEHKPNQGIQMSSAIAKATDDNTPAGVTGIYKITAKAACTITLYVNIVNDSYNSNRTGNIEYSINGGTAVSAEAVARTSLVKLSITVNAGDEVTINATNSSKDSRGNMVTANLWLFGAEAVKAS